MVKLMKKKVKKTGLKKHQEKARQVPIAISVRAKASKQAKIRSTSKGVIVRHTEYLAPVTSTGTSDAFGYVGYRINPGDAATFPWLSRQAMSYEKFKIHKLKFEYTPMCPTTSRGICVGYFEYDVLDPVPTSLTTSLNNLGAKPMNVYAPFSVMYDKKGESYKSYINTAETSDIGATPNALLKYPALFYMCVSGATASSGLGLLRVSYEIEFELPQLNATTATQGSTSQYSYVCKADDPDGGTLGNKWYAVMNDTWKYLNPDKAVSQTNKVEKLKGIRLVPENVSGVPSSSGQLFEISEPGYYMINFHQIRQGNGQEQTSESFQIWGGISPENPDVSVSVANTTYPHTAVSGNNDSFQTGSLLLVIKSNAMVLGEKIFFQWVSNWLTGTLRTLWLQVSRYDFPDTYGGYDSIWDPLIEVGFSPTRKIDKSGNAVLVFEGVIPVQGSKSNEDLGKDIPYPAQNRLDTPSSGKTVFITPGSSSSCRSDSGSISLPSWRSHDYQ